MYMCALDTIGSRGGVGGAVRHMKQERAPAVIIRRAFHLDAALGVERKISLRGPAALTSVAGLLHNLGPRGRKRGCIEQ